MNVTVKISDLQKVKEEIDRSDSLRLSRKDADHEDGAAFHEGKAEGLRTALKMLGLYE